MIFRVVKVLSLRQRGWGVGSGFRQESVPFLLLIGIPELGSWILFQTVVSSLSASDQHSRVGGLDFVLNSSLPFSASDQHLRVGDLDPVSDSDLPFSASNQLGIPEHFNLD